MRLLLLRYCGLRDRDQRTWNGLQNACRYVRKGEEGRRGEGKRGEGRGLEEESCKPSELFCFQHFKCRLNARGVAMGVTAVGQFCDPF